MTKGEVNMQSLFDHIKPFRDQPVDTWHPENCVDIDIRIDHKGIWHYQGSPITRHRIAKLFATVLRKEDRDFFLVTPPVKYRIRVEDAPFNAVELQHKGEGENLELFLRTNMDDVVRIDQDHPLSLEPRESSHSDLPYVLVRDGLMARILRPVYYQLAEFLETRSVHGGSDNVELARLGITSAGQFFDLGAV
jgi:hypothetical protein